MIYISSHTWQKKKKKKDKDLRRIVMGEESRSARRRLTVREPCAITGSYIMRLWKPRAAPNGHRGLIMTTLLLAYSIIHDFLITAAIRNGGEGGWGGGGGRLHLWRAGVQARLTVRRDSEETAGGTTVYPYIVLRVMNVARKRMSRGRGRVGGGGGVGGVLQKTDKRSRSADYIYRCALSL